MDSISTRNKDVGFSKSPVLWQCEADPGISFLLNDSHFTVSQCVGGRSNTTATFQRSAFLTASSVLCSEEAPSKNSLN